MTHEAASGRLLELAYGELSPREAREVEAHATGCDACREELARIRETRALMALLPAEPPPEGGEGIVMAAAREVAAARKPRGLLPPWLWAGTAGAMAAAVIAVVSWQLVKTSPTGPTADRGSDLLARGSSAGIPPSPPPGERIGVGGQDAAAPATPPAARDERASAGKPAPSPRPSIPKKAERPVAVANAEPVPATGPSAWKAAPAEAEATADAYAPPASMAVPAPAPPPAPAPARERSAPEPFAEAPPAKARSGGSAERKAAAPMALRAEGASAPSAAVRETRDFAGCPGELRRIVERDDEGRIVRYVRQGERRTVEHRYGPDGRLVSAVATEGGARRALALDAPGLVRDARDAAIDAPPRCGP
jgi:hypothetical protein